MVEIIRHRVASPYSDIPCGSAETEPSCRRPESGTGPSGALFDGVLTRVTLTLDGSPRCTPTERRNYITTRASHGRPHGHGHRPGRSREPVIPGTCTSRSYRVSLRSCHKGQNHRRRSVDGSMGTTPVSAVTAEHPTSAEIAVLHPIHRADTTTVRYERQRAPSRGTYSRSGTLSGGTYGSRLNWRSARPRLPRSRGQPTAPVHGFGKMGSCFEERPFVGHYCRTDRVNREPVRTVVRYRRRDR